MQRLFLMLVLVGGSASVCAQPVASSAELFDALKAHDVGAMKRLLKNGASPESRDTDGHGILQIAAQNGDIDAMKVLLAAGADIDAPDRHQLPPLQYAVNFSKYDAAAFLLKQGANVDARDHLEQTALNHAVSNDNIAMVKLLLANGADVNSLDRTKVSMLMKASQHNFQDVIPLLIKAGARYGSAGQELLAAAAYGDAVRIRELTASGAPVDFPGFQGETPLMGAALKGQTVAVRALLAAGANPLAVASGSQQTPLFCAIQSGHRSTIDTILAAGADPRTMRGMSKVTSLMQVANFDDDPELAQKFIDAGVDVNAITSDGSRFTALMEAASSGHVEVLKVLLRNGADVNIASVLEGDTALIDAARSGRTQVVELLLKAGADPAMVDHRTKNGRPDGEPIPGKTALDWAVQYDHPKIAALLQARP